MTLAQRMLLAFGLLEAVVIGLIAFGVRDAWRSAEEARFASQLAAASAGAVAGLSHDASTLRGLLAPVCEHDAFVDQTLVALERRELDGGRRLALSQIVPAQMKALGLDELSLVTGGGEILGAGHDPSLVGSTDRTLAAGARGPAFALRDARGPKTPLALVARCSRTSAGQSLSLVGARHVAPMLERLAKAYGVRLELVGRDASPGAHDASALAELTPPIAALDGARISVGISRAPLEASLAALDKRIFAAGAVILALSTFAVVLFARSLAAPIEALARETREASRGEPRAVVPRGSRELRDLAETYNRTVLDLVKLRKRLAATERIAARREIARQVAHEIKNPLAPIRAAIETLRRLFARDDPAFDAYFDEATRTVLDEVHRITRIVHEFTSFARLAPPRPAPFEVAAALRSVVALHDADSGVVRLDATDVPEIVADRDQIVQVVTNLVQNALESARGARPDPCVVVGLARAGEDAIAISVADNGPGVDPALLPRLFEPYATTKPTGTGLGLAIAERIVQEHGGELAYERSEGGGALFRATLPIAGPTLLAEPPPTATTTPLP